MKRWMLTLWCLLPLGGMAYHYGPGRIGLALDAIAADVADGRAHAQRAATLSGSAASDEWSLAAQRFDAALTALPVERVAERRALQLERAKCRMLCSRLPEANADLRALVKELEDDPAADAALAFDARRTWANSEYYMTWLQRLEGVPRDEWEPRIEAARQVLKHLAGDAALADDTRVAVAEDLEAAVRLERMDLGELQGLPLPSQ